MARLPIVPGLQEEVTAVIPNDDQRLEADGFVRGLQEELVDLVALREALFAGVRAHIDAGKLDEATELIGQLRALPTGPLFARRLAGQQEKVFSGDPAVQDRIEDLFGDTRKLLKRHLDAASIEALWRRLQQVRRDRGE